MLIASHPNALGWHRAAAYTYIGVWGGAHAALIAGLTFGGVAIGEAVLVWAGPYVVGVGGTVAANAPLAAVGAKAAGVIGATAWLGTDVYLTCSAIGGNQDAAAIMMTAAQLGPYQPIVAPAQALAQSARGLNRAWAAWVGTTRIASGSSEQAAPMSLVRAIQRGETVDKLKLELKELTYTSGNEHAVVELADGTRAIVSGGPKGIDFPKGAITRLFIHTHSYEFPPAYGPSQGDLDALKEYGQVSSYILEHGVLIKFHLPMKP